VNLYQEVFDINDRQYKKVSRIVYDRSGIVLQKGKKALVKSRLAKRIRSLKLGGFAEYIKHIESPSGSPELGLMIDAITTNKTSFFREQDHFDYLSEKLLPDLKNGRIRFWSAACSSGEEPYTLAIVLREKIKDIDRKDIRILATDISVSMLEAARRGLYKKDKLDGIPPGFIKKYFSYNNHFTGKYQAKDIIKSLVQVSLLNLMGPWPMKGLFNVIFCRNVMIYFDKKNQEKLINRFWDFLHPGGHLFVGHSEGLTGVSHKFSYVRPAIYKK